MRLKKIIYRAFIWRGLNYVSVFLLNIATARILGASVSGEVYYILAFFSLLVLFASLHLESSLTYFSLSKTIDINQLVSMAIIWLVLFSIIFTLVVGFIKPPISFPEQLNLVPSALLFIVGMLLSTYYTALFYGQKSFSYHNMISFLSNIGVFMFLINTVITRGEVDALDYFHFYFIANFVQGLLIMIFFHSRHLSKFKFQLPSSVEFKKILHYSSFTFLTSIFLFLLYRVDYWLILNLNSSAQVKVELGNYIQVSKLIFSFQIFSSMIGSGVFSGTVSNNEIKDDKTLGILIRGFIYIGFFAFLFLIAFGERLFVWIYGATFNLMYQCFLLILPGSILLMTVSVTANYLSGIGKVTYNLFGVIISLLLIVILDLIFIPRFGIYAAAAVSGISYFVYGSYMLFHFVKYYTGGWRSVFNIKPDAAFLRSLMFKRNSA